MDLVRLGPAYNNKYLPDALVEGYNSLIWTERFSDHGEFELKTFDVDGILALLPEDTLVSHLETQHVMMVETLSIDMTGEGEDAREELTVKGRSAGIIFESRWIESTYQQKRKLRSKYSSRGAACLFAWQAVDNGSGVDVTRGDTDPDTEDVYNTYSWTTLDVIPNACVTDSCTVSPKLRNWQVDQGLLWPQFQTFLTNDDADLGFRVLRPISSGNDASVVTVDSAKATRGSVNRTPQTNITDLRFDIYNGVDRTGAGTASIVSFSRLQGHVQKPQYLRSMQPYKSVVRVMSSVPGDWLEEYRTSAAGADEALYKGFQRKTMGFDAGSPELPSEPSKPSEPKSNATAQQKKDYHKALDDWQDKYAKWKNKRDRIWADFRDEQDDAAQQALKVARRTKMFSGELSPTAPYQYKTHYDLGDTVMLYGDHGYSQAVVVSEYVRTEDATGDRGIPGLVVP